jgi:hypothetical protein
MVSKFSKVLFRGILSLVLVPVLFYMYQQFISLDAIRTEIQKLDYTVVFIFINIFPLLCGVVGGILWTIAPLWHKDEVINSQSNIYYRQ